MSVDDSNPIGELSKRLEKLKIANAKKPAGSAGQKVEIQTNLSTLQLKPNTPYFKYDVHILAHFGNGKPKECTKITREDFPEQSRKSVTVALYRRLLKDSEHSKFFGKERTVFYDRAKSLFSLSQLPVDSDGKKTFKLPGSFFESPDMTGVEEYEVVISKVKESFQASSNDLLKSDTDKSLAEVLHIVLGQNALMCNNNFISYGNRTHYLYDPSRVGFNERDFVELPDGKYMGAGAQISVKTLEGPDGKGAAYVGVEVKKTAFHTDDQNLLEKMSMMSLFMDRGRPNFSTESANIRKDTILPQIRDLFVYTKYGDKKQRFPISSIGGSSSKTTVKFDDGSSSTVAQYFKKKYGITLKHPDLFLVLPRNGKGGYPVELLWVCPNQRVSHKQATPDQTAALIKACATLPEVRLRQTKSLKSALQLNETDRVLLDAEVKVGNELVKVPGRVIAVPKIFGANNSTLPTNFAKFNVPKFFQGQKLQSWIVAGLFLQGDNQFNLKQFAQILATEMKASGMTVPEPMKIDTIVRPNQNSIDDIMRYAQTSKAQLVFFVSSDNIKLHNYIKTVEAKMGTVITQEMKVSKATNVVVKNQRQTLHNVIMKTNEKLGGLCHKVQDAKKLLEDNNRLIIGFDISNAPSENQVEGDESHRMPSVVGYAANIQKDNQYFLGDYRYVEGRQADMFGTVIQEIALDCLRKFRANRNVIPLHLVFLFNGITEVQYENLIVNRYMKGVGEAIAQHLKAEYNPHITSIAVTKEHNERLFATSFNGKGAPEQNIAPGTVVDRVIVSRKYSEFFLNSHITLQGTSKTPKYTIVLDSSPLSIDDWQNMLYGLCFRHGIIGSPTSLPAPVYIAGNYAKRGHNVWLANKAAGSDLSPAEANLQLTHKGKLTSTVRVNA